MEVYLLLTPNKQAIVTTYNNTGNPVVIKLTKTRNIRVFILCTLKSNLA